MSMKIKFKEVLGGAEVSERLEVIIPILLCCLKSLFTKTCRMGEVTVEIRKKQQEAPKGNNID